MLRIFYAEPDGHYIIEGSERLNNLTSRLGDQWTVKNATRKSVLLPVAPVVQIFHIGGAGDKRGYPITLPGKPFGPYGNIEDVKNIFSGHLIKGGLYA